MPLETGVRIVKILVPAGQLPRKIGFARTDYPGLEVISACCSEVIRFYRASDGISWRCCRCDTLVMELPEKKFALPDSCRITLNEWDDTSATAIELWVSEWGGCEVKDVTVTGDIS